MRYSIQTPNTERLLALIKQKGYTLREFSKALYNGSTQRNVAYELKKKPDIRSSTLVNICNILDIPIDYLFDVGNVEGNPAIVGNNNIVNSRNINNDITCLRAENDALKQILKEKEDMISMLKKDKDIYIRTLEKVLADETKKGQEQ